MKVTVEGELVFTHHDFATRPSEFMKVRIFLCPCACRQMVCTSLRVGVTLSKVSIVEKTTYYGTRVVMPPVVVTTPLA